MQLSNVSQDSSAGNVVDYNPRVREFDPAMYINFNVTFNLQINFYRNHCFRPSFSPTVNTTHNFGSIINIVDSATLPGLLATATL